MTETLRCAVLYARSTRRIDAIRRYSELLAEHLNELPGCEARFVTLEAATELEPWADVFVLQYNPFSYGRRGFAPGLPARWALLKKRRVIMVHEAYLPVKEWRSALMSSWQRLQLAALLALSDRVLISIEAWRDRLVFRRRDALHLPVPSMLPDCRSDRDRARDRLGAANSTVVLGSLNTGNPAHLIAPVEQAVRAVADTRKDVILLNLGAGAPSLEAPKSVRVVAPGAIQESELARYVAACDVFLCPIADGVSSRRTSVMAALQHEVSVVGTCGPSTDELFSRWNGRAWHLVDSQAEDEAFVSAVVEMALASAQVRQSIGNTGRRIYETEFSWGSTARRLFEHLAPGTP